MACRYSVSFLSIGLKRCLVGCDRKKGSPALTWFLWTVHPFSTTAHWFWYSSSHNRNPRHTVKIERVVTAPLIRQESATLVLSVQFSWSNPSWHVQANIPNLWAKYVASFTLSNYNKILENVYHISRLDQSCTKDLKFVFKIPQITLVQHKSDEGKEDGCFQESGCNFRVGVRVYRQAYTTWNVCCISDLFLDVHNSNCFRFRRSERYVELWAIVGPCPHDLEYFSRDGNL